MTDKEHAEAVYKACRELNSAIKLAGDVGVEVTAEIFAHYCRGVRGDVISVSVRRTI